MQVVDLTQLEGLPTDQVTTLTPTAWYQGFGNAHNININEETGFAYPIGSNTFGGSLHIVDISTPSAPTLAGSFEGDYSHDVQSVVYQGPDAAYAGREIVFCFNGYSGFAIVDAEDKQDVQLLSSLTYAELGYTHQGWVSEDHRYCYLDDELDEMNFGNGTRTYIVDIQDLDNPVIVGFYESESPAIDHNLYVIGDKIYQANYLSGLRILDASNAASGSMELVGFFDTNPESDVAEFDGAWSCYPYFPSGNVGISTFSHFFMVRPSDAIAPEGGTSAVHEASQGETFTASPNPARETVQLAGVAGRGDLRVFDAGGRVVTQLNNVLVQGALNLPLHGFTAGLYVAEWTTAAGRATTRFAVE
jgi:choice-of-anchor B domain-containing protein